MSKKVTLEDFLRRAKEIHGDKYGYDRVKEFKRTHYDKIEIYCKTCKIYFKQTVDNHLRGHGCSRCGYNQPTLEDFLRKAKKVHGDKYRYDRVKEIKSIIRDKIEIYCKKCKRYFKQSIYYHLKGNGCPHLCYCEFPNKVTLEEFIERAKIIHGDKYNYDNIKKFDGVDKKVEIYCNRCNKIFLQIANDHLHGRGCSYCNKNELTLEDFIKKSKETHGDLYDYSNIKNIKEFKNVNDIVKFYCKKHKLYFNQQIYSHLIGRCGCKKCLSEKISFNTEKFIEVAKKIHKDDYDYSKVNYVNNKTPVTIICKKGHIFDQTPSNHILGSGCPYCNIKISKLEKEIKYFLDDNNIKYEMQKTFKWMKKLRLDFYLPDYNIAIECQGGQHFIPVNYFGGKETFEKIYNRDKFKLNLCKKHNIKLLYYSIPQYFDHKWNKYKVYLDKEELLKEIKNNIDKQQIN